MKTYIEKVEKEIEILIGEEKADEKGLCLHREKMLHILFENRKHAIEMWQEKEAQLLQMVR